MSDNKITDWFDEVPSVPDPWQEAKPKLTQKEIKNSAKVYKSFIDPKNQVVFYRIIKDKCHKESFSQWWKLVCGFNKNPVDDAYSIDQYIRDKNIANVIDNCPNHPCYCGACECEK